ncbi:MAG: transposase [Clostridiales bacterium]|nr:transposase [Clostridiales bacterium]
MKIMTTYKVKIKDSHGAFKDTVRLYRQAVDFIICVTLNEWEQVKSIEKPLEKQRAIECFIHYTRDNTNPKYDFDQRFGKFPSYLRRAAISEAIGKVSSYKSNYDNWLANPRGKEPSKPQAGYIYPAMYRDNCFVRTGTYTARLKVFIRNTWDWVDVKLKKSDVDYILRNCATRKECVPTLSRRGKNWYLDFVFEEKVKFENKQINKQIIIGVDLGINNSCTCVAMLSDGTVIGREILKLPREKDCLEHKLNKIKKAQQHGVHKMPRLWAKAKGINLSIANKTAQFIEKVAKFYCADIIVFEYLDLKGKKKGSKKQRLHHWKACAVQQIVTCKAHRNGVRISRVCAWNTSRLAFDGSGKVERDKDNYSMCTFTSGKRYNCDLSASYNIAARYFIREIIKSLPVKARLGIEAKVPQCTKRTTCTLSTLVSLNAELVA